MAWWDVRGTMKSKERLIVRKIQQRQIPTSPKSYHQARTKIETRHYTKPGAPMTTTTSKPSGRQLPQTGTESKIKSVFGVEKKKNKEQELRFQRKNEERLKIEYLNNGVDLILELQKMFGLMLKGKVNRANPQDVLDHLMQKDTNKKVEVGLQKDIVEFLGIFFECLEAGFTVDPLVKCFILYKLVYIKIYFLSL